MKLFLAALMIWSLPLLGVSCGSASVQEPAPAQPAAKSEPSPTPALETVTLTNEHPTGSFALPAALFKNPPSSLEVSITKIVNPAKKPVVILVYLFPRSGKGASDTVEVGNFALYPVDRPGKFMLSAAALRAVAAGKDASVPRAWELIFELDKQGQDGSSPLEVTIAQPNWKSDKK